MMCRNTRLICIYSLELHRSYDFGNPVMVFLYLQSRAGVDKGYIYRAHLCGSSPTFLLENICLRNFVFHLLIFGNFKY
jgi:hypothetical protein